MKIKILYLDDEEYNRKSFYAHFRKKYEIHLCSTEKEVLDTLNTIKRVDIVILNRFIPDLAGFEFLHKIKLRYDALRIIITDHIESLPLRKARSTGNIFDFQKDSWLAEDMEDIIQRAINYMNWKDNSSRLEANI